MPVAHGYDGGRGAIFSLLTGRKQEDRGGFRLGRPPKDRCCPVAYETTLTCGESK
jgi:hypothetical protein